METMFIKAVRKSAYPDIDASKFPQKVHIIYSIQYESLAEKLKLSLEKAGHEIAGFEQVLGCSKISSKAELLLIGSGRFHAIQLAYSLSKEIIIFDGYNISRITIEEIEKLKLKQKAKLSKFLLKSDIGIILSSKPGQSLPLNHLIKLKQKLKTKYQDKRFYSFISETLNLQELENFNIDLFLNTACPGIELDSNNILNIENIK
ncbi:diphthamide synthesis protein [Candidatus Pacearchaeota archaeon]|nr:diphthamide synthesis protein [Candidatus Pacearchaeota archaeon]